MRYSIFTQIVLIIMSGVIFMTLTKPMFAEIGSIQDEHVVYKDALDKGQRLNEDLQKLVTTKEAFRSEDLLRLEKLLPTVIDTPKIMRDIESIFTIKGVTLTELSIGEVSNVVEYSEDSVEQQGAESPLGFQDIKVGFTGSYEELKSVLSLIEKNETLLEINSLTFGEKQGTGSDSSTEKVADEGYSFALVIRVYGLLEPEVNL